MDLTLNTCYGGVNDTHLEKGVCFNFNYVLLAIKPNIIHALQKQKIYFLSHKFIFGYCACYPAWFVAESLLLN